jgi:hypothetical protein
VYVSHQNSLNIEVEFEHSQGTATEQAKALVDSRATENFVSQRTAER